MFIYELSLGKRYIASILIVAIVLGAIIAAYFVSSSISSDKLNRLESHIDGKVQIYTKHVNSSTIAPPLVNLQELESLLTINDLAYTERVRGTVIVSSLEVVTTSIAYGVKPNQENSITMIGSMIDGKYISESSSRPNRDDEIIMDSSLARLLDISIGNTVSITVENDNEENTVTNFKVIGLFEPLDVPNRENTIVMTSESFFSIFGTKDINFLPVFSDDRGSKDILNVLEPIAHKYQIDSTSDHIPNFADIEETRNRVFIAVTILFVFFASSPLITCIRADLRDRLMSMQTLTVFGTSKTRVFFMGLKSGIASAIIASLLGALFGYLFSFVSSLLMHGPLLHAYIVQYRADSPTLFSYIILPCVTFLSISLLIIFPLLKAAYKSSTAVLEYQ